MSKKNVFVIGLDSFSHEMLQRLPQADECEFHAALEMEDIRNVDEYDLDALIDKAIQTMQRVPGGPAAVVSFYDFPGTLLVPILAQHFGLPGPTVEAVLRCENKYWSRLEQQKVIAEYIPQFRVFDPFDEQAYQKLDMLPPFWIKPIKSFRSILAFSINDQRQFARVMETAREQVGLIDAPFKDLMQRFDVPDEIAQMRESFIAESPIGGAQCTLEGYVYNGTVRVYGVVDSIREQDSSSFSRYQYPSMLPLEVQHRMIDVARAAVTQIGLDNAPFNAEFFYDQTADQVWLLEINPRVSQSHANMFEKVHGVSHFSVMLDLALGRKPRPMDRRGEFNIAAKFFVRSFESGRVTRIPKQDALNRLLERQPGTVVKLFVQPGDDLSQLEGQDSYSFELANVFMGGRDEADLLDKYDLLMTAMQFDVEKDSATPQ